VHASQQLRAAPTQTLPSRGARQRSALDFTWHLVTPRAFVRQHVTASGRPQVEFDAQRTTSRRHSAPSCPASTRRFAASRTQDTYAP